MEFEWKNFPGFTTSGILDEIQNMMAELKCEPEHFQGWIIFMSMFNDIGWGTPGIETIVWANSMNGCNIRQKVSIRMLVILGNWL